MARAAAESGGVHAGGAYNYGLGSKLDGTFGSYNAFDVNDPDGMNEAYDRNNEGLFDAKEQADFDATMQGMTDAADKTEQAQ